MVILLSILKLCTGIGLFLFAMYLIEEALKNISGRNFKLFLQRVSKNTIGAAAGGAVITAILQSSSMVSLMVLAFVGAEVFTLKNAMAIMMGANLGTTIDSWIVAGLGFNMNIEIIAYPTICLGGVMLILYRERKIIKYASYFLLGFGLLFIALSFMKTSMEGQVMSFKLEQYAGSHSISFLGIGFLLTLLVQSSSVVMALTLTTLYVGSIDFSHAAAIVLGSETGTSVKIFLSAAGRSATKKRMALGNFLFNVFMTIMVFTFIEPILLLITEGFGIKDPLIGLVTFSTMINLFNVMIFLPFLEPYTQFLCRFYKDKDTLYAAFIGSANVSEPNSALELFRKETRFFIHNSMLFNFQQFEIPTNSLSENSKFRTINEKRKFLLMNQEDKYDFMKNFQGELQVFYLKLRPKLQDQELANLEQLISAVRSSMYSVKGLNDIDRNINDLMRSSKNVKFNFYEQHKKDLETLYLKLYKILESSTKIEAKELLSLLENIQSNFTSSLNEFYKQIQDTNFKGTDITTVINFNRELFTSNKAMLIAVKAMVLEEKQAQEFNELPVYAT